MSHFRGQKKLDGPQLPIIVNVMNFAKGGEGEPSLLSFDDARTLFHEFGHALHGMLSDVTYPMISGTHVPARLRRVSLADLRELAGAARNAAPLRAPLQDRRADAGGAARQAPQRTPVQPGLRHRRIYGLGARRPQAPSRPGAATRSTSSPSSGRSSTGSACRTRSPCVTALRISSISFRAAIRPPITSISGRKFSTPTVSRLSRRAATSSIRRLRSGCAISSMPPAAAATTKRPTRAFAAARPRRTRCSASAASRPEAAAATCWRVRWKGAIM